MNSLTILSKRAKTFYTLLRHNPTLLVHILFGKMKFLLASNNTSTHEIKMGNVKYNLDFEFPITKEDVKEKRIGYYEAAITRYMKDSLNLGDVFIDVGANVGYLTAIGANSVGVLGEVHAFEPIKLYKKHIDKLSKQNGDFKIIVNEAALGDYNGEANINMSEPPFTGNSSLVKDPNLLHLYSEIIQIRVQRLDDYIFHNKIDLEKIKLIKIDVEGYEIPVLFGLKKYFDNTKHRPKIICEIRASLYPSLGYNMQDLLSYMMLYGYQAYNIYAPNVSLNLMSFIDKEINVIFK